MFQKVKMIFGIISAVGLQVGGIGKVALIKMVPMPGWRTHLPVGEQLKRKKYHSTK
jgi:hypothetical protein